MNPEYPEPVCAAERAVVDERRRQAGVDLAAPLVGVALSGGGIRSATFALGLFQALARRRLLRQIDFLSTVSGGGYFGTYLGAALSRPGASIDAIERELADDHSWSVRWLREKGRFLSASGAGDNWFSAAVALRNWSALHTVLLTFAFLCIGLGTLVRADLSTGRHTAQVWLRLEAFFWEQHAFGTWWSPWLVLPLIPFFTLMVPTAIIYWLTQFPVVAAPARFTLGLVFGSVRAMNAGEFAGRAQHVLTHGFMLGFLVATVLLGYAIVDSLGQTYYLRWSLNGFPMPFESVIESIIGSSDDKGSSLAASIWAGLTGVLTAAFGVFSRIAPYIGRQVESSGVRTGFNVVALGIVLVWSFLWVFMLSVMACGFAWQWDLVWNGEQFMTMTGSYPMVVAIAACFAASWLFSRAFGFVNLSSMQQMYAARLARAYIGATNPERRMRRNHSISDLVPGDDVPLEAYTPHRAGGPLHLINVTVNETVSTQKHIERRDRKGLAMAVGPCALSVGLDSHALWADIASPATSARFQPLWEMSERQIVPLPGSSDDYFDARRVEGVDGPRPGTNPKIEALSAGRWAAISAAAFTTGTATQGETGLRLLLSLANVRFGYWWDSGIEPLRRLTRTRRATFLESAGRLMNRLLPVQTCLFNEFFAHFHGPARRHWHLSDGGFVENTGCYELIRRRVPFIICCDAGHDSGYEFADFADLVRKARTDFRAEIQLAKRSADLKAEESGDRFPMPPLEQLVHPKLLHMMGTPGDFMPLATSEKKGGIDKADDDAETARPRAHALLARIHYTSTDEFSWLLLIKPSVTGDEPMDVLLHRRRHPMFPQEATTDQYCDQAQWESYRKLGEHIGTALFTAPTNTVVTTGGAWSPSDFRPPETSGGVPVEPSAQPVIARTALPGATPRIPELNINVLGTLAPRVSHSTPPEL